MIGSQQGPALRVCLLDFPRLPGPVKLPLGLGAGEDRQRE